LPETFLKALAESSAQPQSFAGLQDDLVVAFRVELEGANPVEVHDDGAVDADESRSAQIDLELRQGPAKEVLGAADVETGVVAGGLDPVDVRDIDEEYLAATLSDWRCRRRRGARPHRRRAPGRRSGS